MREHLGDGETELVKLVDAHFHSADGAIGEGDFKQDEGPQNAGACGRRDAYADAPSDA